MARRAAFIGRFQPFHKGHLAVVNELLENFDEIVIAIGSAQEGFTCTNPFTSGERMEMIDNTLRKEGIMRDHYWLIPIPDIRMPLAWTAHVLSMLPRVELIVSGNPHVLNLFSWLGLRVHKVQLVNPRVYRGTYIRDLICRGNTEWKKLVPTPIADYIESINGVQRIKEVCGCEHNRD